ncbi:hypothetical protein CAEBREN_05581 [Caenorhabditis brenneri]|uniref:SPK domain-containing protein n=1 Tax=Caenorhabditis brenneri TaxID=135651 RepID=G0P3G9_CAEBE|nr:hypothetical protein CAEBREN_05581 [Caenorhabditis brenneri]
MAPPISNHPECIELNNYLIERTKDAKSSMNVTQLAEEFKTNSGSSQGMSCLLNRIYRFRSKIHQMDSISTETKVKVLFALGGVIDMDFLNELVELRANTKILTLIFRLRKDAVVEVDGKNRITKYRANDGSLELEGDHSLSAKRRDRQKQMGSIMSPEDCDDGSIDPISKTPRSTKRAAAELPSSSKRTRNSSQSRAMKSQGHAPDDSARIPEA